MTGRSQGEEIRIRHRYRDLILRGRVRLPLAVARKLVGPDCAYHLYRTIGAGNGEDVSSAERSPSRPGGPGDDRR